MSAPVTSPAARLATPADPVGPGGAIVAALLVVLAASAVLADLPTGVRAPLSLLAAVATAARLARHRGLGGLDALLVATGGTLVVLALTGMLLGLSPVGLHPGTWAVALQVVALVSLAASLLRPPTHAVREPGDDRAAAGDGAGGRGQLLRQAPWALAAAAVTVVALVVAVRSTAAGEDTPVQMSLASLSGTQAVVVVSAEEATGGLELRTDPGDGSAVTYPLLSVPAGGSVATTVVVPTSGRVVVSVSNPGQVRPLRTLVVNR